MIARKTYNLLLLFAFPIIVLRLIWRGLKNPTYRDKWSERFGFFHTPPMPSCIWIHTVSLGEAIAATPLITRIHQHYPNRLLLISTTTPTGAAWVNKQFKTTATHVYLPYDYPWAIRRFFKHFNPRIGIIMETELWPNILNLAQSQRIPMVLANARLSPKSLARYQCIPKLAKTMLSQVQHTLIQSDPIAERFFLLGLNKEKSSISGNLKFNAHIPDDISQNHNTLKTFLNSSPSWVAASTHPGEENTVLAAHQAIKQQQPKAKLILAPRHPERCVEVEQLLRKRGLSWQRYTQKKKLLNEDVLLVDTVGELMHCFAASDLAFVGGSLIPRGGHNLIEPLFFSLPILTGPHTFNFTDIHTLLDQEGLCKVVHNQQELAIAVLEHLGKNNDGFKEHCQEVLHRQQFALEHHLKIILPLLA